MKPNIPKDIIAKLSHVSIESAQFERYLEYTVPAIRRIVLYLSASAYLFLLFIESTHRLPSFQNPENFSFLVPDRYFVYAPNLSDEHRCFPEFLYHVHCSSHSNHRVTFRIPLSVPRDARQRSLTELSVVGVQKKWYARSCSSGPRANGHGVVVTVANPRGRTLNSQNFPC